MEKKNIFETSHRWNIENYKTSPIGYPLVIISTLAYFIIMVFFAVHIMKYVITPVPFEIEGSCNTGFIGIDYKSTFDNQPYSYLQQVYDGSNSNDFRLVSHRRYFIEYIPKELNLKNIDGLNCNFKVKGAISLNQLQNMRW